MNDNKELQGPGVSCAGGYSVCHPNTEVRHFNDGLNCYEFCGDRFGGNSSIAARVSHLRALDDGPVLLWPDANSYSKWATPQNERLYSDACNNPRSDHGVSYAHASFDYTQSANWARTAPGRCSGGESDNLLISPVIEAEEKFLDEYWYVADF